MLQQMMVDDKEAEVREAVVRSLGILFGFISDTDKYTQVGRRVVLHHLYTSYSQEQNCREYMYFLAFLGAYVRYSYHDLQCR